MKTFSSDLTIRRLQYQEVLVLEGGYSPAEVAEMSISELRSAIDEIYPLVICQSSNTAHGGRTKKVTVIKKAA